MMPRRGAGDAAATPSAPLYGEHFLQPGARRPHEPTRVASSAAIVSSVVSDTVVGALIAAGAILAASWASHRWSLSERSAERREVRRLALLTQRTADLRELANTLTAMVTAAQEIIWERTATDKPMKKSDERAMRLTHLIQRTKFIRVVVGNDELRKLAGNVSSAANRLSDSSSADMGRDMALTYQALAEALEKVASLIREAESS